LADGIASALVGPGARRLIELEALTKKRFFLEGKPETHLDHFVVLSEGKLADLAPPAPLGEDAEVMLQLVEVDRYDGAAAVGKSGLSRLRSPRKRSKARTRRKPRRRRRRRLPPRRRRGAARAAAASGRKRLRPRQQRTRAERPSPRQSRRAESRSTSRATISAA